MKLLAKIILPGHSLSNREKTANFWRKITMCYLCSCSPKIFRVQYLILLHFAETYSYGRMWVDILNFVQRGGRKHAQLNILPGSISAWIYIMEKATDIIGQKRRKKRALMISKINKSIQMWGVYKNAESADLSQVQKLSSFSSDIAMKVRNYEIILSKDEDNKKKSRLLKAFKELIYKTKFTFIQEYYFWDKFIRSTEWRWRRVWVSGINLLENSSRRKLSF